MAPDEPGLCGASMRWRCLPRDARTKPAPSNSARRTGRREPRRPAAHDPGLLRRRSGATMPAASPGASAAGTACASSRKDSPQQISTLRADPTTSPTICRSSSMPVSNSTVQRIRPGLAAKATPELLFLLARDEAAPPELRLAAAERAASLNVIAGEELARAYREAAAKLAQGREVGTGVAGAAVRRPSRPRRRPIFAPNPSPPCWPRARDQGIEVPVAQALAQASAGLVRGPASRFLRRDRRQDRRPRRRRGKRLGLDRHRRRAHARAGSSCLRRAIRKARAPRPRSRRASTSR